MEQQKVQLGVPQTGESVAQKLPYAPPRATFVPLKLEERLMGCAKLIPICMTDVLS
jgi:hypothetical protein